MKTVFYIVLFFFCLCLNNCSKILFLGTLPTHSHFTIAFTLARELADRDHEVTFVNPYPQEKLIKNLNDIPVLEVIDYFKKIQKNAIMFKFRSIYQTVIQTSEIGTNIAQIVLQNKKVKNLIQSTEKFDVVIIEYFNNEVYVGLGYHFNAPVIILNSLGSGAANNFLVANPDCSSYVPNILTTFVKNMNFWQRIQTFWTNIMVNVVKQLNHLPKQQKLFKKYISSNIDFDEVLYNNISLLLVNSHISFDNAVPLVPAVKEIGGFHVNLSKTIPKDIQDFMNNSQHGVVLFSMGSQIKSKDLNLKVRAAILKSFAKIKQNVLWKFETTLPETPSNVKVVNWLQQQDILAHPNTKAFISHGGLLGTVEAVYFGVPILGIPVFSDQHNNIKRAIKHGFALDIALDDITEESFSYVLDQILNNPKYKENAKKRSKLMQDQPMPPKDLAVYWIEHVIRHKGALHFRSAGLDLAWYQRESIDILAFLIIVGTFIRILCYLQTYCKSQTIFLQ